MRLGFAWVNAFPPLLSSLPLSLCVFRWRIWLVKQLKVAAIWQARLKCAVNTRLWQTELTKPSGAAGCCGCCQAAAAEAAGIPNGNNRKANIYCGWQQKGLRDGNGDSIWDLDWDGSALVNWKQTAIYFNVHQHEELHAVRIKSVAYISARTSKWPKHTHRGGEGLWLMRKTFHTANGKVFEQRRLDKQKLIKTFSLRKGCPNFCSQLFAWPQQQILFQSQVSPPLFLSAKSPLSRVAQFALHF